MGLVVLVVFLYGGGRSPSFSTELDKEVVGGSNPWTSIHGHLVAPLQNLKKLDGGTVGIVGGWLVDAECNGYGAGTVGVRYQHYWTRWMGGGGSKLTLTVVVVITFPVDG